MSKHVGVESNGELQAAISGGRFAQKQVCGRTWLISWGHRRRFRAALDLARPYQGKVLFDYGCGDGTFLAMLMAGAAPPRLAVGGERSRQVTDECTARLGHIPGLGFASFDQIESAAHRGRYDAVFCMEVLEHVLDMDRVLGDLEALLAPEGRLVISVPVETGPPLLVKQAARRLAGLRGVRGYVGHSGYDWRELGAAIFAGPATRVPRIVHGSGEGRFYDHKGFNWMALREEIGRKFVLESTIASPFAWLPPGLGSQVWLVARRRDPGPPAPRGVGLDRGEPLT